MSYNLVVVFKNKSKKYINRNDTVLEKDETATNTYHEYYRYNTRFHINSDWWNREIETWPEDLRFWYYHINTPNDAKECAELFRKYYRDDIDLLRLAEWLDYWSGFDIHFDLSK
jgi:hypothetical protein